MPARLCASVDLMPPVCALPSRGRTEVSRRAHQQCVSHRFLERSAGVRSRAEKSTVTFFFRPPINTWMPFHPDQVLNRARVHAVS
jgi:hypothetical protein